MMSKKERRRASIADTELCMKKVLSYVYNHILATLRRCALEMLSVYIF